MIHLLKIFLDILKPLRKAMVDWNLDISISQKIWNFYANFEPIEMVIKKLSERKTRVLVGYNAIEFAIHELAQNENNNSLFDCFIV